MYFKFIDLCAGIGGFRFALEKFGGKCVLSSEIDDKTNSLYGLIHKDSNVQKDLFDININTVETFDVLCAGFPCQPFSSSGKQGGFKDPRGNVFFGILKFIKEKKPKIIFLENVKNLLSHDTGKTLNTIVNLLIEEGYSVTYEVLNNKNFDSPQNRERLYIIGTKGKPFSFSNLKKASQSNCLKKFISKEREYIEGDYTIIPKTHWKKQKSGLQFVGFFNKNLRKVDNQNINPYLSRYHKQPNRIYHIDGVHPTLSAQESSGRYFLYDDIGVFKVPPRDLLALQGFPSEIAGYIETTSHLNRVIGNAVNPNVISRIFSELVLQDIL